MHTSRKSKTDYDLHWPNLNETFDIIARVVSNPSMHILLGASLISSYANSMKVFFGVLFIAGAFLSIICKIGEGLLKEIRELKQ